MKTCIKCETEKDLEDFYEAKDGRSQSHYSRCKVCQRKDGSEYYAKHKDRINKQRKKDLRDNPLVTMVFNAKTRARKKGLPFDLEPRDLVLPDKCPVLGIPLSVGDGKMHSGSPTLDRFVPKLGYVKGNVYVMSGKANNMKSDGTIEELKLLLKWMQGVIDETEDS